MTREEIMRLEGRELDKAVAERIFGHEVVWVIEDRSKLMQRLPDGQWALVPEYHDNIAAAWQVVERMRGAVWLQRLGEQFYWRDCGRELQAYAARYGRPVFRCKFGRDSAWGFGLTAPEAIARAALLAVCVEDDRDADA